MQGNGSEFPWEWNSNGIPTGMKMDLNKNAYNIIPVIHVRINHMT